MSADGGVSGQERGREKGSGRQPACSLQPAPGLQLAPQGQSRWPGHPVQGTPSSACFLLGRSPDACGSGNVPKDKSSSTRIHQRPPEVGAMECSVEQQLPPQWAPRSPPLRQPPTTLTALHSHVLAAWLTRPLSIIIITLKMGKRKQAEVLFLVHMHLAG